VDEINWYFPDYEEGKFPERDYLIGIISTINPIATQELISQAEEFRSVLVSDDPGDLVEMTKEMRNEMDEIIPQKSKKFIKAEEFIWFELL